MTASSCEWLQSALARAGYEVSTASDGPSVPERARCEQPDVILLDMLLPGMTGPEVLKALKRDPATTMIPIVVFTGLSHKNAERLRQDGACAFLEKSELALEKGSDAFLAALADILLQLGLHVPGRQKRNASAST